MREVIPETVADYLRDKGRVPEGRSVSARALGWGVSNVVMRVDVEGLPPMVLKQSRERLRTEAHWVSRLDRIWTETAALRLLETALPPGDVPRVLFDEPADYLFAMSLAPEDSAVWKEQLLAGRVDPLVAQQAGKMLGAMHAGTVGLSGPLADKVVFDQLRIDPFYRTTARAHPAVSPRLDRLIRSLELPPETTFVHGDFSPKNLLVHAGGLTAVDFETAHAGDPAFDLGFFLSHLLLKAFRAAPDALPYFVLIQAFWDAYLDRVGVAPDADRVARACDHTAACALARVDGKSPVDYLDDRARDRVRRFATAALQGPPATWDALVGLAAREMQPEA